MDCSGVLSELPLFLKTVPRDFAVAVEGMTCLIRVEINLMFLKG